MIAWLEQVVTDAHAALLHDPDGPAASYLRSRNVQPQDTITYRVGVVTQQQTFPAAAPSHFLNWAKRELRGRLVFPVTNTLGHVIGLTSRALDAHNYETFYAADRTIYPPVFGLAQAANAMWRTRQVVLVEGVFDLFAIRSATGIDHVLATLTANTTVAVERLLSRYCQRVVCAFDMDEPGRAGCRRVAGERFTADGTWAMGTPPPYAVTVLSYPAHDPSDWLAAHEWVQMKQMLEPFSGEYGL